jgi:hypothetical protein
MADTMDPVVQQPRRSASVEIIDVDSLDDVVTTSRLHASVQPRSLDRRNPTTNVVDPEAIAVLDSDEEDAVVGAQNRRRPGWS